MVRSARISVDGLYRYELRRTWDDGPDVAWCMLNPSTANAESDDPTIRRLLAFSHGWGFGGLIVVNLFAWRASKPEALRSVVDPVGPENQDSIEAAIAEAELVVCAWGAGVDSKALRGRPKPNVTAMTAALRKPTACLGRTEQGRPVHPLYVASDVRPVLYEPGPAKPVVLPRDQAE
jgi:hypothetical protein